MPFYKFLLGAVATGLVIGCQSNKVESAKMDEQALQPYDDQDVKALIRQLTNSVEDVETAVSLLSQTNNAMATELLSEDEKVKALERADRVPPGFDKRASLQWFGPLNQLAERLGIMTDYQVKIVGSPIQPLMIKLDMENVPIVEMYRSIQYQTGNRAIITAENQIIHITYPSKGL